MLANRHHRAGTYTGSVILLTDGTPYPDTTAQMSAIQQQLVPEFKSHGWPIDTIALGSDQSFHPFLSELASATSGSFYDDGHGVVPGVSPLNITPFFLDIFRLRNGRSPGPTIAPTQAQRRAYRTQFQRRPVCDPSRCHRGKGQPGHQGLDTRAQWPTDSTAG